MDEMPDDMWYEPSLIIQPPAIINQTASTILQNFPQFTVFMLYGTAAMEHPNLKRINLKSFVKLLKKLDPRNPQVSRLLGCNRK